MTKRLILPDREQRMDEATTSAGTPEANAKTSPVIIGNVHTDPSLRNLIEELSGEKVVQCYQCGECTGGCPMAFAMDLTPNQVMRYAQLGVTTVLDSSAIWLCAGCETCATRCPRSVSLSKVMDALRQIALSEGRVSERSVAAFHKIFIDAVGRDGRVHEVGMLGRYKMVTRDLFSDMGLGMRMLFKGKLKMMPDTIKSAREVREIIRKCKEAK